MFDILYLPWGFILTAVALVHFFRRRPDMIWLFVIIFGGWIGSLVYIALEMAPDLSQNWKSVNVLGRRQKISRAREAVETNPSPANLEELADLYLEDKDFNRAKQLYDRAISTRTDSPDPYYRRGICEIFMHDYPAAVADLEHVVSEHPRYDLMRAEGLLAHAYAKTGRAEEAERFFKYALQTSTLSETMYNYAQFLREQGRQAEAREWTQKILGKKSGMPGYLKRRERPWFRKASSLLHQLPR